MEGAAPLWTGSPCKAAPDTTQRHLSNLTMCAPQAERHLGPPQHPAGRSSVSEGRLPGQHRRPVQATGLEHLRRCCRLRQVRLYLSSFRVGPHGRRLLRLLGGGRRTALIPNALDGLPAADRERGLSRDVDELAAVGLDVTVVESRRVGSLSKTAMSARALCRTCRSQGVQYVGNPPHDNGGLVTSCGLLQVGGHGLPSFWMLEEVG